MQSLILISLVFFLSCKTGYKKPLLPFLGKVTFNEKEMAPHDVWSFEDLGDGFARDKDQAFFRGIAIENADGASFELLEQGYAKDQYSIFFGTSYLSGESYYTQRTITLELLEGENPDDFVVLQDDYAKGTRSAYWNGKPLNDSHGPSFEVLGSGFARDKNTGYYEFHKIYGSQGSSFYLLEYPHTSDSKSVYYEYFEIVDADPNSFVKLSFYFAKDANYVYHEYERIQEAHAPSFVLFENSGYAKDNYNGFWNKTLIIDVDIATFEAKPFSQFARDANNYFYREQTLSPSDDSYSLAVQEYE